MKDSKENLKLSKDFVQISTLQSANVLDKIVNIVPNMGNYMLRDTTIHAFTFTWETASMDSTVSSLIPSKDKLSSHSQPKISAEKSITKTIALKAINADFLMISEMSLAFIIQWENVNSQMESVDFLTKRKWK